MCLGGGCDSVRGQVPFGVFAADYWGSALAMTSPWSTSTEGWGSRPSLNHRYHGFLNHREDTQDFCWMTDWLSPFSDPDFWTEGLGLPFPRTAAPGTLDICSFLAVNFHSYAVERRWPTRRSARLKWCADSGLWTAPRSPEATDTFPSFKGRTLLLLRWVVGHEELRFAVSPSPLAQSAVRHFWLSGSR